MAAEAYRSAETPRLLGHDGKGPREGADAAFAQLDAELRAFYRSETSAAMVAHLEAVAALFARAEGGIGDDLRVSVSKSLLITMGADKMGRHGAAWTPAVATAFGDMLRAHRDGVYNGGAASGGRTMEEGASSGAGPSPFGAPRMGPLTSSLLPLKQSLTHLRNFSISVTSVLLVVLVISLAANRNFGPFYLSNLLLTLLSISCIVVCVRTYESQLDEVRAHELMYIGGFCALAIGGVMSVIFTFTVPGRISQYCAKHESQCESAPMGLVTFVAFCVAICTTIAYVAVYSYGLVLSDRHVQLIRISVANDGTVTSRVRTELTPFAKFIAGSLMPSRMCARRHATWIATRTSGSLHACARAVQDPLRPCFACTCCSRPRLRRRSTGCTPETRARVDLAACMCCCLVIIIVPIAQCANTESAGWCFVAKLIEITLQILAN